MPEHAQENCCPVPFHCIQFHFPCVLPFDAYFSPQEVLERAKEKLAKVKGARASRCCLLCMLHALGLTHAATGLGAAAGHTVPLQIQRVSCAAVLFTTPNQALGSSGLSKTTQCSRTR